MPVYAAKAGGFFFIVFGVLALMAATVHDQPDLGLRPLRPLPGDRRLAARLVHGLRRRRAAAAARLARVQRLRVHALASTSSSAALILLPVVYLLLGAYPFVEKWVTGDNREHHLLERPRNNPMRTGIGMAGITAYCVLLLRRRQRHHGDQARPVDQRHHLVLPDRLFVAAAARVLGDQADLPVAAAPRPRHGAARPRDRHASCARPTASSSSGTSRSPSHSRAWVLVQHEAVAPIQLEAAVDENGVARSPSARSDGAPGCRGSTSPTRSTRSPRRSSRRPTTTAHEHEAIEPSASGGERAIEAADDTAEVDSGEPAGRH